MNRINPEDVLNAYQQIEAVPITGTWYAEEWGDLEATKYCCGLTAVAFARGMDPIFEDEYEIEQGVRYELKLDDDYIIGFIRGFDGVDLSMFGTVSASVAKGFSDGAAARNLLIEEGYL